MENITDGQIRSLKTGIRSVVKNADEKVCFYIVSGILKLNALTSLKQLSRSQWKVLRNKMYPYWINEDWEVGDDMRQQILNLHDDYREKELGQLRLF